MAQFEINLKRAPGDPPTSDPEIQRELGIFNKSLGDAGVAFSQRAIAFDSADALGYPLAEFVVKTLGPTVIPVVTAACGAWIQARYGRKVRLKIGDIEAEGRSVAEVEDLLKKAAALQDRTPDSEK